MLSKRRQEEPRESLRVGTGGCPLSRFERDHAWHEDRDDDPTASQQLFQSSLYRGPQASTQVTKEAISTTKPATSFITPFRRMIRQLSKLLSFDEVSEMVFLADCKIVDETKYRQKPLYYLIETLEKEEKITEKNVDCLIDVLREIDLKEALKLVENYKQTLPKEEQSVSSSVCEPAKTEDLHVKIAAAWKAVMEDDRSFSFHNTPEIAQFIKFLFLYKKMELRFEEEITNFEHEAKEMIRNAEAGNVIKLRNSLFHKLNEKVTSGIDKLHTAVEDELQKQEFESVRAHTIYFTKNMYEIEEATRHYSRMTLELFV